MSIRDHVRHIRSQWRRADTVLHLSNIAAFAGLWWNCTVGSPTLVLLLCSAALVAQAIAARHAPVLRRALFLGAMVGVSWPLGEGVVVRVFGWWGEYLAPGPRIWDTPLYCVIIGALASAHCAYVGKRAEQWGYGLTGWAVVSAISALAVGILGENMFVWAGMWRYETAGWMVWDVPLFVPVGYGLGYATLPLLRSLGPVSQAFAFNAIMLVFCVGLGVLTRFFPR